MARMLGMPMLKRNTGSGVGSTVKSTQKNAKSMKGNTTEYTGKNAKKRISSIAKSIRKKEITTIGSTAALNGVGQIISKYTVSTAIKRKVSQLAKPLMKLG